MIIQSVFVSVFLILIIQFLINLGLAFLIKQDSIKRYKIISYIVFIGFAFYLPIVQIVRLILIMKNSGAPDAIGLSMGFETIVFWIVNIICMTGIQLIFNQSILTKIVRLRE